MERVVFVTVLVAALSALLAIAYRTKEKTYSILFIAVAVIGAAFYLFQFGSLGSFSFKALSAEANFIKEKATEVKQDAHAVDELRKFSEKASKEIEEVKKRVLGIQGDFAKVKAGLVEIEYLMYVGRNIFPNPYHDRIMQKLNELLVIAVPDERERAAFVQELSQYTTKGNH